MTDTELLTTHLASRDVPCPKCQYNLRGVSDGRCPECGETLSLEVSRHHDLARWWKLVVVTLCVLIASHIVAVASIAFWLHKTSGTWAGALPRWFPYFTRIVVSSGLALVCIFTIVRATRMKRSNPPRAIGHLQMTLYVCLWIGIAYSFTETLYWFIAV